jgi:serine/threonine-protein kinase
VSSGPSDIAVPPVKGLAPKDAKAKLLAAGFLTQYFHKYRQTDPKGKVYAQLPVANQLAAPGSYVKIYWSDGPAPSPIPDLHGYTCDAAMTQLESLHLVGHCVDVFDDTVLSGQVVSTTPPAPTVVPQNTSVTINVSKGPELVVVPDVVRHTVAYALKTLHEAGFVVHVADDHYSTSAHVFAQTPKAGKKAPKGSTVILIL